MTEAFRMAKGLAGERVRMRFVEGREVVAVLFSATTDTDGREHLVFGDVAWSSDSGSYDGSGNTCYYEDGTTLVAVDLADAVQAAGR